MDPEVPMRSRLLQLWMLITTNPTIFADTKQLPWDASDDEIRAAANQVVANLDGAITDLAPDMIDLIGSCLLGAEGADPGESSGNFAMLNQVRNFYQSYAENRWSGAEPHPGIDELSVFFKQYPVAETEPSS